MADSRFPSKKKKKQDKFREDLENSKVEGSQHISLNTLEEQLESLYLPFKNLLKLYNENKSLIEDLEFVKTQSALINEQIHKIDELLSYIEHFKEKNFKNTGIQSIKILNENMSISKFLLYLSEQTTEIDNVYVKSHNKFNKKFAEKSANESSSVLNLVSEQNTIAKTTFPAIILNTKYDSDEVSNKNLPQDVNQQKVKEKPINLHLNSLNDSSAISHSDGDNADSGTPTPRDTTFLRTYSLINSTSQNNTLNVQAFALLTEMESLNFYSEDPIVNSKKSSVYTVLLNAFKNNKLDEKVIESARQGLQEIKENIEELNMKNMKNTI